MWSGIHTPCNPKLPVIRRISLPLAEAVAYYAAVRTVQAAARRYAHARWLLEQQQLRELQWRQHIANAV